MHALILRSFRACLPGRCLAGLMFGIAPWLQAALSPVDFTDPAHASGWIPAHDVSVIGARSDGLHLNLTGGDPYLHGPARDYPEGQPLWLHLRLRSAESGMAQVFYFPAEGSPSEEHSVRFAVPGGDWFEAKVRLPALGPRYRLRLDPPGSGGTCVLGRLWFTERLQFALPDWPQPGLPDLGEDPVVIESGELRLRHRRDRFGAFLIDVAGRPMAASHEAPWVGYLEGGVPRWFAIQDAGTSVVVQGQPLARLADAQIGGYLRARATRTDPDGGQWQFELSVRLSAAGALEIESLARCDRDREVLYLPLFTLLPGLGSYGTNKTQALLAGIEYLENEPSSSTADLNPPGSNRQVPDTAKLTFPLMAIAAEDRYLGLAWHQPPDAPTCAVFDSPDRLFHSGAHVMGLLFPGSDGLNREENSLLPYDTARLRADRGMRVRALLLGGRGQTVVPAVQEYVRRQGLPPSPAIPGGAPAYLELAARGWLDSEIRDGDLYRHATPGFGSQPAADAALYQDWLATRVEDPALAARLTASARAALSHVPPANLNHAQVGHIRYPVAALVYGSVPAHLTRAEQHGQGLLRRFVGEGLIRFQKSPQGLDYARTHWAADANGLTAQVLAGVLAEAAFTGQPSLIDAGLHHLRALTTRYRHTVPRGAQTWEIPLHTPDILAAAYLVQCYVRGYELSGDPTFLEEARYWAWTGVPFVYLHPPTAGAVGPYSTIAVLGATQWIAPNWIGLPVQWCGLVYAEALHELARHDPQGPWTPIADGIALSGIQQTYPATDPRNLGLLPDSFSLRTQARNPANINPATVLAPALRTLRQPLLYDTRALPEHGLRLHAPGALEEVEAGGDGLRFRVRGWSPHPYFVVVNGLPQAPEVRINGRPAPLAAPHEYQPASGRLLLRLEATATVELRLPLLTLLPGPVNGVQFAHAGQRLLVYGDPTGQVQDADTVLLTHARRDVTWAADRPVRAGAKLVVPDAEAAAFTAPQEFWQRWRDQRFHDYAQQTTRVPVQPLPVHRTVRGGDAFDWHGRRFEVLDTPGYTRGAVSYVVQLGDRRLAFTGDLFRDDGRLPDLFSFQDAIPEARIGGYHGWAGRLGALLASLDRLGAAQPDLLVPARGPIIHDPPAAIARLRTRIQAVYANYLSVDALRWYFQDEHILAKARRVLGPEARVDWMPLAETRPLPDWIQALSNSRLLLAADGAGFLVDCGSPGIVDELRKQQAAGTLTSLEHAFITHYHDDHTDALPLLVQAFGTRIHAAGSLIAILERPGDHRLPCLTRHPTPVTAPGRHGDSWRWKEYQLTLWDFPGQTLHHNALLVERPGHDAFLFAGDSFTPSGVDDYCLPNRNFLAPGRGYLRCLDLLEQLPEGCWIINQHVGPAFRFSREQRDRMRRTLEERRTLLANLFPFEDPDFGLDEGWAVLHPYAVTLRPGAQTRLHLRLTNHAPHERRFRTVVRPPPGWTATAGDPASIASREDGALPLTVTVPSEAAPGLYVLTADVVWEGGELREWVEALLEVRTDGDASG